MKKYIRTLLILTPIVLLRPEFAVSQSDSGPTSVDDLLERLNISNPRSTWLPLDIFMEPSPVPSGPGEVGIRLTVVGYAVCDEVTLRVSKAQNLEFLGSLPPSFSISNNDTVTFDLPVIVPANDTSGLEIDVYCDRVLQRGTLWFEATGDSISWSINPPWGP